MGKYTSICENSSPRGCKTRAHLEEGINDTWNLTSKDEGQSSKEGPEHPTEGYNKHPFFGVNMVVFRFKESTKHSEKEKNPHRTQDAGKYFGIFLINEGNDKWYNQESSLNKQELGNKKADNRSIHGSLPLQQVVNMSYIL